MKAASPLSRIIFQWRKRMLGQQAYHAVKGDNISSNIIRGLDHIRDPRLNKGMAFTLEERMTLGIHGLLPPRVKTQEEQVRMCKENIDSYDHDINKYIYLCDLQDRNERLFYRLLAENVEQMMPIVYTPTVGLACQKFGLIYRRPRGLFITINDRGHILDILKNWPESKVKAVVVTDGERILGLGDLGAYGMGIPVGKLALYTALAGVKPHQCLPILLDVGTNNPELLGDPNYLGLRRNRITGQMYDDFVDEFMEAVVIRYGQNTLIQFEDFALHNSFRLLNKYQLKYCTFNDDIQGTAAVALAGLEASLRVTNTKMMDNTFLFLGAGGAATGIVKLIVRAMVHDGISEAEAASRIWLCDVNGLICQSRSDIRDELKIFSKDAPHMKSFLEIIHHVKPTAILGASASAGAFNQEILETMAKLNERPVVFALSNPTSRAECTAEEAYKHTDGRVVFASGSPFEPVTYKGKKYVPGQGNNAYIFPGVALGVLAAGIRHITDDIFFLAAKTLAESVAEEDLAVGRLYPAQTQIHRVSMIIAKAIVEDGYANGTATTYPEPKDKSKLIERQLYDWRYAKSLPTTWQWPG
jgi:malate dehydrogenase (oxaloacetate-decarboxylating)(NADP+)